jgi:hypothetical protein
MASSETIHVEGLRELQRAFARLSHDLSGGVKEALEAAAEPVRSEAASLAHGAITGMSRSRLPWWQMRVGVTRSSVYVAPVRRGPRAGSAKRPNLAPRMMNEAMLPALAQNQERVVAQVSRELDELFRFWERNV